MNTLGLAGYASSSDDSDREDSGAPQSSVPVPPPPRATPSTQASRVTTFLMDGLPSEPPGDANPETQARIARFLEMQRNGKGNQSFQDNLQNKKDVANPYILDKVVEYFGIDELQSNFAPEVFDPHGLPLHEFSDKIAMEQKKRADDQAQRLHASQFQRNEVQFVSAKQPE